MFPSSSPPILTCRKKKKQLKLNQFFRYVYSAGQEDRLNNAVITVLFKCLSYDFAGTNLDDAGEDFGVVQVNIYHSLWFILAFLFY